MRESFTSEFYFDSCFSITLCIGMLRWKLTQYPKNHLNESIVGIGCTLSVRAPRAAGLVPRGVVSHEKSTRGQDWLSVTPWRERSQKVINQWFTLCDIRQHWHLRSFGLREKNTQLRANDWHWDTSVGHLYFFRYRLMTHWINFKPSKTPDPKSCIAMSFSRRSWTQCRFAIQKHAASRNSLNN
jgi:hypothetical protein